MKLPLLAAAFALLLAAPAGAQNYQLVWQDEFDGSSVDPSKWEAQIGNGCPGLCGWGNNELQYYRSQNATVSGGFLTITAKRENFGGAAYTSARLRTLNRGDFTYGRFEARIKLPAGRGLWPAFWMLPTDSVYGTWAASGEIDIMEYLGQDTDRVLGTIHYGGTFPGNTFTGNDYSKSGPDFTQDFHVFALEWDATELRWFVDDVLYATQTNWFSSGNPYPAPFNERFHLLLNMAVGGNLPGSPDGSTPFPAEMVVDYVRVYEQVDTCFESFDGMEHGAPYQNGWFRFDGSAGGGGIGANTTDLSPFAGERASIEAGYGGSGTPGFIGGFGRRHPMDLTEATHFEFWINPDAGQDYILEINLQDDDNGDNEVPGSPDGIDDEFQATVRVSPSGGDVVAGGGWQHVILPFTQFVDDNSYHYGGNGQFDPRGSANGGNGMMVNVVIALLDQSGNDATFRTDRWAFTRRASGLTGRVVDDANGDGVTDTGENGIAGVEVVLENTDTGLEVGRSVTDESGVYGFFPLRAGDFEVRIDENSLAAGFTPTVDPDGVETPSTFGRAIACDEIASALDFGFSQNVTSVPTARSGDVLHAPVPNPFNPRTVVSFDLAKESDVRLTIYDAAGRRVRTLLTERRAGGTHSVVWNGQDERGLDVSSGVFFARLESGRATLVQRMVLVR